MQQDIPLVMVHGLFGPLRFFQPSIRMSGITVHTPDMLGYDARATQGALTLDIQANEIVRFLRALDAGPCHLLGHSVGGVVAILAAELAPQLVKNIISVEGNFTLDDAFMCRRIAPLSAAEWQLELQHIQSQPAEWLIQGGISVTNERLQMAHCILYNQSAATLQVIARSVVKETADPAYLDNVKNLMKYGMPLHLVAGSRSAEKWNVPEWVRQGAASSLVLADCGHMMMLENPDLFCNSLMELLYSSK